MFIDWETLDIPLGKAKVKIKCPQCIDRRSNKRDKSLQVNVKEGFAKCHYCEALSFRSDEENTVKEKEYSIPIQTWRNYTTISDKLVKWIEEERKIRQFVLKN